MLFRALIAKTAPQFREDSHAWPGSCPEGFRHAQPRSMATATPADTELTLDGWFAGRRSGWAP